MSQTATPERRPVTTLRGVGDALADKLARLGVFTVQDLLFLLPLRYEDRTRVVPIGSLRPGDRAVVEAEVELTEVVFRGKRQLLSRLSDGSGFLTLRFFHFTASQQAALTRGVRVRCFGDVRRGPLGLEIVHPEYRIVVGDAQELAESLTPVYPATEGVQQGRLRRLTELALAECETRGLTDWLPRDVMPDGSLPALVAALQHVHRPPPTASLAQLEAGRDPAQRRLAFEELLAHHLSLKRLRHEIRSDPAWPLAGNGSLVAQLRRNLPFGLTGAQQRVAEEIAGDLREGRPMLRLVQGDVGCGKTVVAAFAALQAIESGAQVALMAPTELLAEQHARNFAQWFDPLGVRVGVHTGRQQGRARAMTLQGAQSGQIPILIGTHALFEENVRFARLALAIVDEQHRFGVHQRLRLRDKGSQEGRVAHQLVMTATPIPRTLAMSAYADLDVSVIDELPPGRTPVKTVVMPEGRRDEIVARIHQACRDGRQAYWVCPLIDESEAVRYQAAEETAAMLAEALPDVRVGLIHGRMNSSHKDAAMQRFKRGELQLLIATTVIEVGVDVPNASLMVVENSERMGLAQLHQLRGRVGRGQHASTCVLLYRAPLSAMARDRLAVLRATNDGFEVARRDLELRGPGEVLGTRQTGLAQMRVADLMRDADLLPRVHQAAELMARSHAANIAPLIERWVGGGSGYGRIA